MALARSLKLLEECINLLPEDEPAYMEAERVLNSFRHGFNSKLRDISVNLRYYFLKNTFLSF